MAAIVAFILTGILLSLIVVPACGVALLIINLIIALVQSVKGGHHA